MNKLIYQNDNGNTLEFGGRPPFLVTLIDGLGSVQNEISTSKSPYQDGVSVNNKSLSERHLTLEGVIITRTREERQRSRRKLIQMFNPKSNGELTIYQDGEIRRIDCIPELAPSFPSAKQENYQPFMINLYCPNPYWQDINTTKEEVAIWRGSFEFPLELVEEGIEMGYREPSLIVNILNKGDVATGMRIQFKALATVVNPSFFNVNTREYFKVNRTMEAGEIITVTTHFQNKRVELNKNGLVSNAFNWIDFQSTFLQLNPGDNLLRYDADEGLENLAVTIYYTPQYLGV